MTTGRRGGRRRLVVDSCATRWREKLVGAGQGIDAGRATLEWSRDYRRTRLEGERVAKPDERLYFGSVRCSPLGTSGDPPGMKRLAWELGEFLA